MNTVLFVLENNKVHGWSGLASVPNAKTALRKHFDFKVHTHFKTVTKNLVARKITTVTDDNGNEIAKALILVDRVSERDPKFYNTYDETTAVGRHMIDFVDEYFK